ncbi:type II toxin-antitoxin system VapC family toxin [Nostoc sp. UCD121]|uniref:type II toxin-antitoxin system VapC family toxin n=1 Tax=unclassified Nostoc TaxID=2593658 RepID=UPI00162413A4|nr:MULTISPECIES: type II toxin-antitoxin system VapC family toxin [unclassified Nostoc]MBC1219101.1 type II toxin-antitoxin system VapC family toxin [Nostoc sp. UCD120]MBC1280850.1 type II toxin-antitoxin system VapC family toxin [Nostoc sp. UCD121]MBC1298917.1 type II toxin-antitoxin system VapC family toxin [Nostoc sp. UCD122]
MKIVLDTCALIWWSLDPARLSEKAKEACDYMERDKNGLVPSIAIWEIALKIKNKKLDLGVNLNEYVVTLKKSSTVQIVPIDENIWMESANLEWGHRDPVDRVVVALARSNQAAIITSDKEIANFYSEVIW